MNKTFSNVFSLTAFILISTLLTIEGCNNIKDEGFAIFLTRDDIPPSQMETLGQVEIAEQPIISITDIVSYDAQTHEIVLTPSAYEHICSLEVPVNGKSFIVCVDKKPIYWGAFWTPISSISFNGITIWKPLSSQETKAITLELGYPSSAFYNGNDPRNNAEVMKSLGLSGKLINELTIFEIDRLPHSIKGYELYSWSEDGQWHFTLITGTNRTKTLEEIVSEPDFISETGWVNIHTTGVEVIISALSKLPLSESIGWCDELHIGEITETNLDLQLPPEHIVNEIKECAVRQGLDFQIMIH